MEKIVIVGGGSSGWLSAATLVRYFPNKKITLVESKTIPTIGVGESTTSMFRNFINNNLGIQDKDFMPGVDAVYKMSVYFKNFYKTNDNGFHYPFGAPKIEGLEPFGLGAWGLAKYFHYVENKNDDFTRSIFYSYELFENNKISLDSFDNYNPKTDLGYHLNANKLGTWLKDNYCTPRGVNHIYGDVIDIVENENGISHLILQNNELVYGDLFIDCTGFKSLLLGKIMKPEKVDVSHKLLNNRAWATPIKYKNPKKEMKPYTSCTALGNGWAWYTPIWSRSGNGYAYCDKYTTAENALEEFKQYLLQDKFPIKLSKEEVDNLPFFQVPINSGYYKESMVKNVVGIGLSAGFLEPLEGTGLSFVSEGLLHLVKILQRDGRNQFIVDSFNLRIKEMFDLWADTLSLFYAQSIRKDTEYWKEISGKNFDKDFLLDNYSTNHFGIKKSLQRVMEHHSTRVNEYDIYTVLSQGCEFSFDFDEVNMDHFTIWNASKEEYKKAAQKYKNLFEQRKNNWKIEAEKRGVNMYNFLLTSYKYEDLQ